MKLLVISHKETWADPTSPTGYSTIGGFPFQMSAISQLFNETTLLVLERASPLPSGAQHLTSRSLRVMTLPEPRGRDIERKLRLLTWIPRHLPFIWRSVRAADAVHAPVPGDLGTIGILVALMQKKCLFVRHCGRWGKKNTLADRFLLFLLERIAGGRNVVLATGGDDQPPSQRNPSIHWIFATSLRRDDMASIHPAKSWQTGDRLKLITVGALNEVKNTTALIQALSIVLKHVPNCHLELIGSGHLYQMLFEQAQTLKLMDSLTFLGNLSHQDVLEFLSRSHIFLLPSHSEGFPKALLEAMAAGLPVVASSVSVIPYLLGKYQCGILLNKPDAENVAKAVLQMIANPQQMKRMGDNARKAAEGYTLEKWGEQIRHELESAWKIKLRKHQPGTTAK